LSHHWLSDTTCRAILLNELLDTNSSHFYIRVYWPPMIPRYGQLREETILEGYKELCTHMSLEDRTLVLPTTNLTGWLCVSLGATGFSMGPLKDQQCFSEEPVIKRPRDVPTPSRKKRYFERNLLHVVDLETHDLLLDSEEYSSCTCPYCRELNADIVPRTGGWNHEAASLHQIFQTADLTSQLNHKNPRGIALREVTNAISFLEALNAPIRPRGENNPAHLSVWKEILQ